MTEESLYQKIFASHFGHLAIIFLWTSGNLFHVAWQGNFQQWVLNPLKVKAGSPFASKGIGKVHKMFLQILVASSTNFF